MSERHAAELRRAQSATFWKGIVGASVVATLSVALYASLADRRHAREESSERRGEPASLERTAAEADAATAEHGGDAEVVAQVLGDAGAISPAAGLELGDGGDGDAGWRHFATPEVAPSPAPPRASLDAVDTLDAGDAGDAINETAAVEPRILDAGEEAGARRPWAPPTMSAGAGPFITEAPYWAASAFPSNPNAGAGPFITEAPYWTSSAMVPNPEAGAGPFTTERNIPAFGVWPYWPVSVQP